MSYPGQDGSYSRVTWQNYPSVSTPIDEINLNNMDARIKKMDETLETWDGAGGKADKSALAETNTTVATKANQSDLLLAIKSISFDSTTGVFTFTKFNNTTITVDTLLEKLVTNFDYDDDPTSAHYQQLVLTLADGTVKYIDMAALITQYEFTDTSTIAFTIGNDGKVSANVIDGSITANKLQPNYLADVTAQATNASNSAKDSEAWAKGTRNGTAVASTDPTYHNNSKYYSEQSASSATAAAGSVTDASNKALDAEAFGAGTRNGVDVPSTDPAYHNNAKYYSQQAAGQTLAGLSDVDINSQTLANGDVPVYNSTTQKWENGQVSVADKMDKTNPTGTGSFSLNRKANTTVGANSFSAGTNNTASGDGSHAEGSGTKASGFASHAEGAATIASSYHSHAEGYCTEAKTNESAHAEGCGYNDTYKVIASGKGSHAEGVAASNKSVTASGTGSHAEGEATTASGYASHAEGYYTTASSANSHAEGESTTASASDAHAEGYYTTASGTASHAEGRSNTTSGNYSHAEGYFTETSSTGEGAHAEGRGYSSTYKVIASGRGAHAEGSASSSKSITASAEGAHAEGYGTTANGNYAHAEGNTSTASGTASHAEGCSTASGLQAHSENNGYAQGDYSHSGGKGYCRSYRNVSFVHGNTDSNSYKFRGANFTDNYGTHVFGFDVSGEVWTSDTTPNFLQTWYGIEGAILNTATVTLELNLQGQYILICSSYTISSGAVYGATARLIVASGSSTGTPTNLSLNQTSSAPATITMAANNKITIKNGASTRATQFSLIRIN